MNKIDSDELEIEDNVIDIYTEDDAKSLFQKLTKTCNCCTTTTLLCYVLLWVIRPFEKKRKDLPGLICVIERNKNPGSFWSF